MEESNVSSALKQAHRVEIKNKTPENHKNLQNGIFRR